MMDFPQTLMSDSILTDDGFLLLIRCLGIVDDRAIDTSAWHIPHYWGVPFFRLLIDWGQNGRKVVDCKIFGMIL